MATKFWGPMGWMTLHSISVCYPEIPNDADKAILVRFLERFQETISCPHCKTHFTAMFGNYKRAHPEWANTRFDLFLMICRIHNTVNRRLDKPRFSTVKECLAALTEATKLNSPSSFRNGYLTYLYKNWAKEQSGDGFIMVGAVKEMIKINNEYWCLREVSFDKVIFLAEADTLEAVKDDPKNLTAGPSIPFFSDGKIPSVGFKFIGGKLRLGSK